MALEAAVLAQLGILLERLAGRSTLASVFVAAGVLASLVNLSAYPMGTIDRHVRRDLRPLWTAAGFDRPQPACTPNA